ncbi:MAG TPA: folylpolyglutamate synthase/dihydrofolate synthase family protein [Chloroflexota bacterium]|nr:folylpolyglutamate synthase/dihydrofolate synthase family protein [Chloroflexota bacterium]
MTDSSRLQASFDFLDQLYRRPILPPARAGLARIEYLLQRLDNPHQDFPSIHVTGTCGKGSTATMIASILQAAGYRTGLFRSPHLDTYRERIAIDSTIVDSDTWSDVFEQVRVLAEAMEADEAPDYKLGRPSLFELVWAMGALHFSRAGVDISVVEVGVGGRLSPTNVLQPHVSVLTNVSLDHTAVLGPTETEIAREKAQIIKPGSSAITAASQPEVLDQIRRRCQETGSSLWMVGQEITSTIRSHDLLGEVFDIRTPGRSHRDLSVGLLGRHQVTNASTAVGAIDQLMSRGFAVTSANVRDGLASVRFPGRFEIVSEEPLIVLDGARNVASARVLRETLDDLFPDHPVTLVIGVLGDKDAFGIVDELAPRAHTAVVTDPPWEGRAGDPVHLITALGAAIHHVRYEADIARALELAIGDMQSSDLILVTGSMYLVAAVRHIILGDATSVLQVRDRAAVAAAGQGAEARHLMPPVVSSDRT